MSLEQLSNLAQVVASVGVIVSLIFVGLQIRHNTHLRIGWIIGVVLTAGTASQMVGSAKIPRPGVNQA